MRSPTIEDTPIDPRMYAVNDLRASAPQIGLAMGVFFVVVGVILGNYGVVGLGVVVGLAGFFARGTA